MLLKPKPKDDTKLKFAPMGSKPKKYDPSDETVKANLSKKSKKSNKKSNKKSKGKGTDFAQKAAEALAKK